jgi:diaminohydroxyphosphoribosylaminopyrimidine deaminase / 5-amino-6-(5-phosphoribosylamino)uracil reductase
MPQTLSTDRDLAWSLLLAAGQNAERMSRAGQSAAAPDAIIAWRPDGGWENRLPPDDRRSALIDLYLPICSATAARPVTVGHLGQSLDGFIATHSGESRWVTGQENILHLHRLRALSDAVIVGAGTVAADDPQLTTRLVPGPNPLRVVLDPTRRLTSIYRVFNDDEAETIYACAKSLVRAGEDRVGRASVIGLNDSSAGITGVDIAELVRLLRARGCTRIFVEGGGVTVSMFLAANLLDRLHVAIAPLIIGDGKPAIRLPPRAALGDCHRPRYRVFRMGGDILFDCEINTPGNDYPAREADIARVI